MQYYVIMLMIDNHAFLLSVVRLTAFSISNGARLGAITLAGRGWAGRASFEVGPRSLDIGSRPGDVVPRIVSWAIVYGTPFVGKSGDNIIA